MNDGVEGTCEVCGRESDDLEYFSESGWMCYDCEEDYWRDLEKGHDDDDV